MKMGKKGSVLKTKLYAYFTRRCQRIVRKRNKLSVLLVVFIAHVRIYYFELLFTKDVIAL